MSPYTRRDFAKLALSALPAAGLLTLSRPAGAAETTTLARNRKPNSRVAGVQIGLNVPYSFANPAMSGEEILGRCLELGLSAVELRAQPVEAFLGVPAGLLSVRRAAASGDA